MTRISRRFTELKQADERGLVAYLTAGDPSLDRTPELVAALERGGADVIELGVPFSDPIADGPVIQRASERALRGGTSLRGVLDCVVEIRRRSEIPLVAFSYLNPVLRYGFARFAADAAAAGLDGVLLTDLSVEEADPFVAEMRRQQLDTIFWRRRPARRGGWSWRRGIRPDSSTWSRGRGSPASASRCRTAWRRWRRGSG